MLSYFIKSGLCLGLLLIFYHLFLEKEKMHHFNRFYLLGSVLFSFLAPLFIIYVEPAQSALAPIAAQTIIETPIEESVLTINNLLLGIYVSIVILLSVRFVKNIIDISLKIGRNEQLKLDQATIVLVEDDILPHTFWNYIFINRKEFHKNEIEEELFTHELAHVTQKHTIDVILLELLQIILWFNPFIIWLKKAVQLNHEFLADDSVVSSHNNISYYQTLLLNKAAWNNKFYLASNLNYSLTKKRLLMMKTPSSKLSIIFKKLAILPLLVGFVFVFANRVEAQSKKKPTVIEVKEVKKSATKAQMLEYNKVLEKALKVKMFKFDEIKRLRYLYSLMSNEQKKSVKNVYDVIPPPPPPAKVVIKELKKTKNKKAPKPIKIEVVEKKDKSKVYKVIKTSKKEKQEKINDEYEEVEIIEIKEKAPLEEEIEIVVSPKEGEKGEYIEIIEEEVEKEPTSKRQLDLDSELELEFTNSKDVTYYIDNKKVSQKKARKLLKNSKKVKSVEVIKDKKGNGKVMITTK